MKSARLPLYAGVLVKEAQMKIPLVTTGMSQWHLINPAALFSTLDLMDS